MGIQFERVTQHLNDQYNSKLDLAVWWLLAAETQNKYLLQSGFPAPYSTHKKFGDYAIETAISPQYMCLDTEIKTCIANSSQLDIYLLMTICLQDNDNMCNKKDDNVTMQVQNLKNKQLSNQVNLQAKISGAILVHVAHQWNRYLRMPIPWQLCACAFYSKGFSDTSSTHNYAIATGIELQTLSP